MSEREIFKQYANLNEDELNTKSNKKAYGKNETEKAKKIGKGRKDALRI